MSAFLMPSLENKLAKLEEHWQPNSAFGSAVSKLESGCYHKTVLRLENVDSKIGVIQRDLTGIAETHTSTLTENITGMHSKIEVMGETLSAFGRKVATFEEASATLALMDTKIDKFRV